MRAANLARVLRLVHDERGLSRSDVTRHTGLNRSTVGSLVTELAERALVAEEPPPRLSHVGRPSLIVRPAPGTYALAVHPEVDTLEVGLVDLGGRVVDRRRVHPSEVPSATAAVALVGELLDELRAAHPGARILGMGVAVPALVRARDGIVRLAPHLGWRDVPLGEMLATATGLSVQLANDASVGAQAESMFGAGRDADNLVYLNGGASGIGGGIVAAGALYGGVDGFAGEFGHVTSGGSSGSELEEEVTRRALLDVLALPAARSGELATALRARVDEPNVRRVVRAQQCRLARVLGNVVNVLNPQVIVLGGFLHALLAADPDHLRARLDASALAAPLSSVTLVGAKLGDELLMVGAAELVVDQTVARLAAGY